MLDNDLLKLLVCPSCKGALTYETDSESLLCPRCRLRYAIRDGIPLMLVDEAEPY